MPLYRMKYMEESLSYGALPGAVFPCQDKSWMDSELFCGWKRHFISAVKPMTQQKRATNLVGHNSDTLSLVGTEIARRAASVFPQHSSNAASGGHVPQDIECIHGTSDHNEAGAETLDRTHRVARSHGLAREYNVGKGYEWDQEYWTVVCRSLSVLG
jgi:hypothetical protein